MGGMRWWAVLLAASVAGCSPGASAPPTSAPPSTPTTTSIGPATTTTLPSTTTSNEVTPVRLRISVGIDGSYPGGSLSHVEMFRLFPESDAFPVPVLVADTLGNPDVTDMEVDRGTYEVRTYQRPCAGSCAVLQPPADGCAVGMEVAGTRPVNVHITVRPGQACEADVTGAAATEPARSMDLTLAEPGGPGCDPPSPYAPWFPAGALTEMLGTGSGDAVMWALWWDRPPLRVRTEIKLVLRLTGTGPFDVVAIHEDGTQIEPNWGPNDHGPASSSYGRPGNEWGMAFFFTQTGCWNLHVTRGADTVDAWVEVGGRD